METSQAGLDCKIELYNPPCWLDFIVLEGTVSYQLLEEQNQPLTQAMCQPGKMYPLVQW